MRASERARAALSGVASAWLVVACQVDSRTVRAGASGSGGAYGDVVGGDSGRGGDLGATFEPDAGLAAGPAVGDACSPGSTCAGDRRLGCDGGRFVEREVCPFACLSVAADARCGGECKPTTRSCSAAGVPLVCDERGEWQPGAACGGDAPRCVEGSCRACQPGERRCSAGGLPESCAADGSWAAGAPCPSEAPACLGETGECAPCVIGEQRDCDPGPEAGSCSRGTQTCEAIAGSSATRFGACTAGPASDGTACDDGDAQTIGDSCAQGACAGARLGTLASGRGASCAVRAGGAVYCWGDLSSALPDVGVAPPTRLELPLPAVAVSVGDAHACAVLADETLRCWGSNGLGTLGNGTDQPAVGATAVDISAVAQVAAGAAHTAAVTSDGLVHLWGDYTRALGQTELFGPDAFGIEEAIVAAPLAIGQLGQVTQLGLGFRHICAVLGSGQVVCWGRNDFSQLGRPSLGSDDAQASTTLIVELDDAIAIASGDSYSCALRETGAIRCWGSLFTSDLSNTINLPPADVPELDDAVQVSVGASSACALRRGGSVACWGGNASGELGTGSFNGTLIPQPVVSADGEALSDVVLLATTGANAGRSICALRRGGSVACWGANDARQLGDRTTTNRARPVQVLDLPD